MTKSNLSICIIKRKFRGSVGIINKIAEEIRMCNLFGYTPSILVETEQIFFKELHYKTIHCGFPIKCSFLSNIFKWRVKKWIAKHKPDLVISHNDMPSDGIAHVHNCVHLHHEKVYGKPLPASNRHGIDHTEIYRNTNCRLFIANSRITKQDLVIRHGVPPEKIAVVYPELDLNKFNPDPHKQKRLVGRKTLGILDTDMVIGLVTSGDFEKRNVSFYLDVIAQIVKQHPLVKAVVVGKDKLDKYKEQASRLGILDSLIFHPVVADVENIYHALDLTILPAHHEEFGYVVTESIACGTPCLVSDGVGAGELYIDNEMQGMVLPLGNADQWADQAIRLLEDTEYREKMIKKGIDLSIKYTEENAALYKKILRQAIKDKLQTNKNHKL